MCVHAMHAGLYRMYIRTLLCAGASRNTNAQAHASAIEHDTNPGVKILAWIACPANRRSGQCVAASVRASSARSTGVQDASVHGRETIQDINFNVSGSDWSC